MAFIICIPIAVYGKDKNVPDPVRIAKLSVPIKQGIYKDIKEANRIRLMILNRYKNYNK